ncbi:MAG: Rne/Rng family ribonuclease [Devosia sp.]
MATKRMLVDAIHPEETRIVVTSGNRLEEFDFESATRRQLRGNIYLAKVTRVEPSLQAAFIEYGGNRHGFLAFSEIHPDYYQIPVADREALLRDEEAEEAEQDAAAENHGEIALSEADDEADPRSTETDDDEAGHIEQAPANAEPVESIGGGDALEEMPERRRPSVSRRNYKIQEVIKRRQVMLVQVVKEERGNKGAALTTYLSLAGRYSVLMPNTARGGGISRKITNAADRKRLKDIVGDLEVPQGQGIILRTAGASRTKAEVKRDFEYLQRLWENVRSLTLKSVAPCLVYEEGSLIKRTIRDLYNKEIDELLVAGDDAHREAKDFMRMIMPSHAKNVQLYKEDQPIFSRYNVESQLDSMFSPQVTLPSGGYIVINPTEALVSIDVNSGRSTKEHNIEDTALQTNLEAADEIARQLRLRDLAGLIVIDFIDMVENRNNRAVERKLKDCLKNDRARIQVGRISHFGLMEMSRQRIRFGVVESSTHKCPTCQGTGLIRSVESLALMVMRNVEDHVLRKHGQSINLRVPTDVALYILNTKRGTLSGLEARYDLSITIVADDHVGPSHYAIERGEARLHDHREQPAASHVRVDTAAMDEADAEIEEVEEEEEEASEERVSARADDSGERAGRRHRRRRRGGERGEERDNRQPAQAEESEGEAAAEGEEAPRASQSAGPREDSDEPRKRRRRGRRGGRRNRRPGEEATDRIEANGDASAAAVSEESAETLEAAGLAQDVMAELAPAPSVAEAVAGTPAEKPKRARRTRKSPDAESTVQDAAPEAPAEPEIEVAAKPKGRTRKPKAAPVVEAEAPAPEAPAPVAAVAAPPAEPAVEASAAPRRPKKELPPDEIVVSSTTPEGEEQAKPKKAGWWQRGFFGN